MSRYEGVYAYKGKRGTTYYYVVDLPPERDENGKLQRRKIKSKRYRTAREASDARRDVLQARSNGVSVKPTKVTLGEYLVDEWLPAIEASGNRKAGTMEQYRLYSEKRIAKASIGSVPLQEIDAPTLNHFYRDLLAEGLSSKYVRNIGLMLSTALKDAVRWRLIQRSPATDAELPKATRRAMSVWTPEQLRVFLDHVREDRLYALWRLTATTGMRRGEVLGLRWSDVDLDGSRVSVVRALVVVDGELREESPKTERSRRSIALDRETVSALRAHRKGQMEDRLAWGEAYEHSGYVFTKENGAPLDPRTVSRRFSRISALLGLPAIRTHDLRHTYATAALQARVPAKVVSERLGHASIAITLDTYSHVLPQSDEEAATTIAAMIDGK